MTSDTQATVHGLKSRHDSSREGTHVCGYVRATNGELPLYIELRDTEGKPSAERGQIGDTPANRSKVNFMCRNHAGW